MHEQAVAEVAAPGRDTASHGRPVSRRRGVRVVSNLARLADYSSARFVPSHTYAGHEDTLLGGIRLFFRAWNADVLLLNGSTKRLLVVCLLRWLFPFVRFRLVSLDVVLSPPSGWRERLGAKLKRFLFRRVDLFIHYFRDLTGYERWYGVSPAKSVYIPFKVNLAGAIPDWDAVREDGDYVLTAGQSRRDLETFAAAMRLVPYPGIVLYHDPEGMKGHGTNLDQINFPPNVRCVDYQGCETTWAEYFRKARIVAVPILPDAISASGITTYLLAMALGRCVVVTDGPATRGILSEEALLVPPADPEEMAQAITWAWENDWLRRGIAQAGWEYAVRLGDESRLLWDILEVCGNLVHQPGELELMRRPATAQPARDSAALAAAPSRSQS
jgi:glycosyltransferase involved in cell wall biosynthesis